MRSTEKPVVEHVPDTKMMNLLRRVFGIFCSRLNSLHNKNVGIEDLPML